MVRIELILILFIVVVAGACCCYIVYCCFWLDFWVGFGFRLCLVVGGCGLFGLVGCVLCLVCRGVVALVE